MERPHAQIETIEVKEGERFPLDWHDEVRLCVASVVDEDVTSFKLTVIRRGL